AMVELGAVADHLESFRQLVKQSGDPWFAVQLAELVAEIDIAHHRWFEAEAHLRGPKEQDLCKPGTAYRCMALDLQLGLLYQDLHRVPEAIAVLQDGLRLARGAG